MMGRGIPFSQYFNVHQYTTVDAGQEDVRVFYGNIPDSCVGFIYQVANSLYDDVKYDWYIDGELIEKDIERMVGDIDAPAKFDETNGGPYLVKNNIEWKATNSGSTDELLEVLVNGVCYMTRR